MPTRYSHEKLLMSASSKLEMVLASGMALEKYFRQSSTAVTCPSWEDLHAYWPKEQDTKEAVEDYLRFPAQAVQRAKQWASDIVVKRMQLCSQQSLACCWTDEPQAGACVPVLPGADPTSPGPQGGSGAGSSSSSDSSDSSGSPNDSVVVADELCLRCLRAKASGGRPTGKLHLAIPLSRNQAMCGRSLSTPLVFENVEDTFSVQGSWSPRCWGFLSSSLKALIPVHQHPGGHL